MIATTPEFAPTGSRSPLGNAAAKLPGMWSEQTLQLIRAAMDEDLGPRGDISAALLPNPDEIVTGYVTPRQPGIICGLALAPQICAVFADRLETQLDFKPTRSVALERPFADGDRIEHAAGDDRFPAMLDRLLRRTAAPAARTVCHPVATVSGPRAAVLMAERTLLNFLCRMSGVATFTHAFVLCAHPDCKIVDTRKTLPGWRELDKYAVRCGGGRNHRMGLYDAVLIKDNHLAGIPTARLAPALFEMLNRLPTGDAARPGFVEVEVDSLEQFREVCKVVGVNIILLDNFDVADMATAVRERNAVGLKGRLELEASGGVTLENVAAIAATGVDRIAIGALTHSAPALDIGLDFASGASPDDKGAENSAKGLSE